MKLVMNRDDLTALNYLQYFVQENILNSSLVSEIPEKSQEELKEAVAIIDSIVCIGVNLQESDCEIRLEADDASLETKVPCLGEAKDLIEVKEDKQKLLLKKVLVKFFERNEVPKKVLLDIPSTSN